MSCKYYEELKILSVGNSFSVDTMEHLANIALNVGFKKVKLGNLFIGGCSINKHYNNAMNDIGEYKYYVNNGEGWSCTENFKSSDAIKSEEWDIISIQHGTKDGSRYTSAESYEKLPALIDYVKSLAPNAKIAFNMAWVSNPDGKHHEIRSYNGDQMLMYRNLLEITQTVVKPIPTLDIVSPTGTAVQNARTTDIADTLLRDGFHLSYMIGRYIGGLTFLKALTGAPIDSITWAPEGVGEHEMKIAVAAANAAIETPFEITKL